jgi:SAM-dependent methyltransferase
MTTTLSCPLCGDSTFKEIFEKKGRHFFRCESCSLEKQHPLPTGQELSDYYEGSFRDGLYKTFTAAEEMKRMTARQRLKEISPHVDMQGRWLDVGCANGEFINHLKEQGYQAEGIELSDHAVNQAKERGLKVRCGTMEVLGPEEKFAGITAFDVIEHVLDPLEFLQQAVAHLEPGGKLAMTMPDKSSVFCKLMGARWYFYIPEEHLHYFDPEIMRALFAKVGLKPLFIGPSRKPLTFDYGLTQFQEYNPLIYKVLKACVVIMPKALRQRIIAWSIGELMAIGVKE